ncbi:MAG: hypothetical protein OXC03_11230 [Flavobacteriaceae bacterium]|nr:hypothetical protein [Flavobacteriaceae bacterium]
MTPDRKKSTVEVIKRLLNGEDYRIIIQNDINLKFLNYCIDFFKEIINAKVKNKDITMDWYKNHFIDNEKIKSDDIAIYAGINKKNYNQYIQLRKERSNNIGIKR